MVRGVCRAAGLFALGLGVLSLVGWTHALAAEPDFIADDSPQYERRDRPPQLALEPSMRIERVSPSHARERTPLRLRIEGAGFERGVHSVRVGLVPLGDLFVTDDGLLGATLEPMPRGVYDLTVERFDGTRAVLREAVTLGGDARGPAPRIVAVVPAVARAGERLWVEGESLASGLRVELGGVPLEGTWLQDGRLELTAPSQLPPGHYVLAVVNPDGQYASATLEVEPGAPRDSADAEWACSGVPLRSQGSGALPLALVGLVGLAAWQLRRSRRQGQVCPCE